MNLRRAVRDPLRKATTGSLLIVLLPALLIGCSR